jgi:hypothetical protein
MGCAICDINLGLLELPPTNSSLKEQIQFFIRSTFRFRKPQVRNGLQQTDTTASEGFGVYYP